jgi:hypothetical protein
MFRVFLASFLRAQRSAFVLAACLEAWRGQKVSLRAAKLLMRSNERTNGPETEEIKA